MDTSFASDNWSGLCPEALDALVAANSGSAPPYGADEWTEAARAGLRELFETDAEIHFVVSGTAANSLALAHLVKPYQSILCHEQAHIRVDECGAPALLTGGAGLQALSRSGDGRITAEELDRALQQAHGRGADLRYQPPALLSLTQTTEFGTVYPVDAVRRLAERAKSAGLKVHMDGARLMAAVAALDVTPAALTWQAGVDVLTLGSSKLGGGLADAILFFDRTPARGFAHRLKQSGQVPGKFRLLTAPWVGLLKSGQWLERARHANTLAADLERRFAALGWLPAYPREANALFVKLPPPLISALEERGWRFHLNPVDGAARFMCGWDASPERNGQLESDLRAAMTALSLNPSVGETAASTPP